MVARPELNHRPDARADSVEDLVEKARRQSMWVNGQWDWNGAEWI
jgi:hypothetical protein